MAYVRCHHGHEHWGPRGAAGILVVCDGHVLLQHRSGAVHHGNTWSILGGAIEASESPLDSALREASEEAGLDRDSLTVVGSHLYDCGGWTYTTVIARSDSRPAVEDSWEGGADWIPVDEVSTLQLHPAFAASWEALRSVIG